MAITIQQIKELREATAAGMGACKEALTATDGNMEEAVKYLREKGLAVAAKRVDKESKQGIVALAVADDKKSMALAEVNCETDFVAKTDAFKKFVDDAAKVALEGKDIEQTLNDDFKMLLTKTGENVKIRRSERYVLEGTGVLSGYIHMGGKIGVLVEVGCTKPESAASQALACLDVNLDSKERVWFHMYPSATLDMLDQDTKRIETHKVALQGFRSFALSTDRSKLYTAFTEYEGGSSHFVMTADVNGDYVNPIRFEFLPEGKDGSILETKDCTVFGQPSTMKSWVLLNADGVLYLYDIDDC